MIAPAPFRPDAFPPMAGAARAQRLAADLPEGVWRGSELGSRLEATVPSGWAALDHELPGGGWPTRSLTEILAPQPAVTELRLVGKALRAVSAAGGQVILVGPPKVPHLPGLLHEGLSQNHLVLINASSPAERLWVTEQMIKSNAAGAVIAWVPQVRQDQVRRLQVCAQGCEGLVFLCRPEAARHEASAAPLRLLARYGLDWELELELFKRRGPAMGDVLRLPSIPGGLERVLTPRLLKPSRLFVFPEAVDAVVGGSAPRRRPVKQLAVH